MAVTVDANTIALYKFNDPGEDYNGAIDSASYGGIQRNATAVGTTTGIPYSTDGPGLMENGSYARSFPTGSNTYLQRSADTTMVSTFLASYTAECWINPSSISAQQIIFCYGTSGESLATNILFSWNIQATSGKQGVLWEVASGTNVITTQSAGSGLSANTWQHIAVTVDNSGATSTVKFYLNGVLQDTITGVTKAAGGTSSFTQIGTNQNTGGTDYFHGAIKSFVIRDTAYTASQIAADAAMADWEHAVDSGTVVAYQMGDPPSAGTGYSTAIDSAIYGGTRRNLSATGEASSASVNLMHIINGPGGTVAGSYARWFPGTLNSAAATLTRAGDATLVAALTASYTLECWIKMASLSAATNRLFEYAGVGETLATNLLAGWEIVTGGFQQVAWEHGAGVNNFATQNAGSVLSVDVWYHIAVTVDNSGATSTVKFYRNGTLQQTITGVTKAAGGTSASLTLGGNNGGTLRFHGAVKSIVLRNTAYSDAQIAADAARTTYQHVVDSGTVLAYQFNELPDALDETSYGYHLRRADGSIFAVDPLYPDGGYSKFFDTATVMAGHLAYAPLLAAFLAGVWTFDCWIRLNANYNNVNRGFFAWGISLNETAVNNVLEVLITTTRKLQVTEEYSTGTNSTYTTTNDVIATNTAYNRHHLAIVHNGTTITVYLDGVQVDSGATTNVLTGSTDSFLVIGASADSAFGSSMSGSMDNARFRNIAASASDILATFNDGGASTPNYDPNAGGARRATRWGVK